MSEQYWREPSQTTDIFDETPNKGKAGLVGPVPYKEGQYKTLKDVKRCQSCNTPYDPKLTKCPECGATDFRSIEADRPIDITPRKVTNHLKRGLSDCWNQKESKDGEVTKHHFDEVKVKVISVLPIMTGGAPTTAYEIHDEVRCKQCSMPYQRVNGQNATDEEIADFKAGKIERASKFLGQNWIDQR